MDKTSVRQNLGGTMKGKDFRKNKGITLIALVVTIIVLLILAGISIMMLTGENGILRRAGEAREKTDDENKKELAKLSNYEKLINKYTNGTGGSLADTVQFENINTADTDPKGALPDNVKEVIETDANKGIVIKDINDNEWVWVEVPKTEVFSGLTINVSSNFTDQNYQDIADKLNACTEKYRNAGKPEGYVSEIYKDEWHEGCGLTESEYEEAYESMLRSVYVYGGFWIGRYEAGIEGSITDLAKARTEYTKIEIGTSPKAISQKNAIPYNWISCDEAELLAKEMSPNVSYQSNLMFGVQWDLVCKFLENKSSLTESDIISDSTSWGNYSNSKIEKITEGKYSIVNSDTMTEGEWQKIEGEYTKNNSGTESKVLLSTGASEYTKRMNIYDFAGNMAEFSLGKLGENCMYTGNDFGYNGIFCNASKYNYAPKGASIYFLSFRPALYNRAKGINLSKRNIYLMQNESETIEATLIGISGKIKWESSDTSIAQVKDGKITAGDKLGTVIITAKIDGTEYSAECIVNVIGADPNYSELVTILDIAPSDLFEYAIIDENAKTAEITGINTDKCVTLNQPSINVPGYYGWNPSIMNSETLVVPYKYVNEDGIEYTIIRASVRGTYKNDKGSFNFLPNNIKTIIFPNTILEIGNGNAYGMNGFNDTLEKIIFPNKLKKLGGFESCKILSSVKIPETVTEIESGAFFGCTELKETTIPEGVETIGYGAFDYCNGIKEITIPRSVKQMGKSVFYDWKSTQKINIQLKKSEIPSTWDEKWLNGCSATINYLPEEETT